MPERVERQQIFSSEYWTFMITMIVGGLAYSIISFSYMHSTFTTRVEVDANGKAQDKYESTVNERLTRIEDKLDKLIQEKRR